MIEQLSSTDGQNPIPSFQFSTDPLDAKEQFDGWRDFMAPMSDLQPVAPPSGGFRGGARAYDLGALKLTSIHTDPVAISYTKEHMRKYGIEHWSLNFVTRGNIKYASGNNLTGMVGNMYLQTYTAPFSGIVQDLEILHLMLDRDYFYDIADELDKIVDRSMAGPMSRILQAFFISIGNHADGLSVAEIPAVNEAFKNLLKASVRPNADTLEAARLPIAATQFAAARRVINDNLKSPSLTPDMICSTMGISRRQLYYIFEQHGGVMKFISQRRLTACYNALVAVTEKKLISSIAYEYGFTNLSSFYRQFQARYGFSPSEARSAWLNSHTSRKTTTGSFADWLLRADEA